MSEQAEQHASSLAMLRATLNSTTDGILVTDAEGRVSDYNQRYAEMSGAAPGGVDAAMHAEDVSGLLVDPAAFLARIDEIRTTNPAETFDVLTLTDGRVLERTTKAPVVDGRSIGRVWIFRDITERRKAEDALRDETRVLELLNETGVLLSSSLDVTSLVQAVTDAATTLSGAQFGAFFYNTVGIDGDEYMLFTLSGAPREAFEHLGHPRATPLFGPTLRGEGVIRCDDVLADPRYGHFAPHRGMPPGHLPVRSYLAVPVTSRSGAVIGGLFFGHSAVGVFTARTERIISGVAAQAAVALDNARLYETARRAIDERNALLERERDARAHAERLSALKDEFLATLSHELRTPLSAMVGWVQVLRRGVKSEADLRRGLEVIERNAHAQTHLIEDLLDMNRITSGKLRLDVQLLAPVAFVEAALETVRPAAEAKGVRIRRVLDPDAGPVAGDAARMQQVVWNLLSNAIKFTPPGGDVQVLLHRVAAHVEIQVSDSGVGIAPEFVPHVFERFRQADASTARRFGGLGLGLSIVKHLVELHGGSVRAESLGVGQGATFTVALPVTAVDRQRDAEWHVHARPPAGGELAPPDLSSVTVLVVDDDADTRELIERLLRECGARVLAAESGAAAVPLVARERPDVLLSDIAMPDVDGYELLRRVRALGDARGGSVPAIALTAFAGAADRTRALRAGFLAHLSKPIEAAELAATVAAIARRDR